MKIRSEIFYGLLAGSLYASEGPGTLPGDTGAVNGDPNPTYSENVPVVQQEHYATYPSTPDPQHAVISSTDSVDQTAVNETTVVNAPKLPDEKAIKTPNSLATYEKSTKAEHFIIRKIKIKTDKGPLESEDFVRTHMRFSEGEEFDPHAADDAIHSLHAIGMFDTIDVEAFQNLDQTVDVVFNLTVRPKIRSIKYPHERVSNKKLKTNLKTVEGGFLDRAAIHDDVNTYYQYYQIKGFPKPVIKESIVPAGDGYVDVIFDIVPGKGVHISNIVFNGFGDVPTRPIEKKMGLKTWNLFSFFTKRGYFVDTLLEIDRQTVMDALHDAGYLDAKLTQAEFIPSETYKGSLVFTADLGSKYTLGVVDWTGNTLYDDAKIQSIIRMKEGDAFNPSAISDTAEVIQNYYRYHGYLNTYVEAEKLPTFKDNVINVRYKIHEAPLCYVNAITVNGNYKTKNKVILRELSLAPGDKYNYVSAKASEHRLKNTGFFENVTVDAVDSSVPDQKDIRIDVKENNTGKFQIGGAISAKHNQMVFVEIAQSNFDLFGKGKNFQGSGQKAHARFQLGTREHALRLSFEEPYLLDKELAFGVDVFGERTRWRRSDEGYNGDTYDENEIGFEPYFRKRIYELWTGRLAYNFTWSKIKRLGRNASSVLKREADMGHRTDSAIKFLIERDTRDSYLFPRSGTYFGFETQFSGVGGRTKFTKLDLSAGIWYPISERYDHSISLRAKLGTICPHGHKEVPYSERYFLGGDTLMRGFESHEISPKETIFLVDDKGNPKLDDNKCQRRELRSVGGIARSYIGAEYTFNIFENFYGAAFFEAGAVNDKKFKFFKHMNTDAGFGLRIFINNMPLRLDWGWPIHRAKDVRKDGVQFNFSFGCVF